MANEDIEDISGNSQARRWVFTINNPFGDIYENIDISKTDLKIKEDYYKSAVIDYLTETKCFVFKYIKISVKKDEFVSEDIIIKRPFFKDWDSVERFFDNVEHRKYVVYQMERGEDGTEHLQGAIFYSIAKRFRTVKDTIPFAHIEKAKGSNSQVRDYCTKKDTRIKEPVEIGTFAEERERTDIVDFVQLIQSGMSKLELSKLYPSLYLRERNKIDMIYADLYEDYSKKCRDVDVTYIYGGSGLGKSSYVRRKLGLDNTFWVHNYDNSMFTNYKYEDVLVLDEFASNLKIQTLNMMLDVNPFEMRGLNCSKYATYHHVYIISNYRLTDLYKNVQIESPIVFQALNRRIHKIIRLDRNGNEIIERDTDWEENTNEIDKQQGLTRQVKCTYEFDHYGNKINIYNRYSNNIKLIELDEKDNPFIELDEDCKEQLKF